MSGAMASSVDFGSERQAAIKRAVSGPFRFQHSFTKDNPGHIADFYEIGNLLGRGAYGSAYLTTCKQTRAQRAVKKIAYEKVKDPEKFEREISIAKQLDHPNLVRLFEIFRGSKNLYLVMELCTGGELFERIMEEAPEGFGEATAARYVRQMLAALSYLHAGFFAHRDVKPENFLLQSDDPDASLKLIDFGLACRFTPGEPMHTKAGTPYYVAPEVLDGSYGHECDVWSAGVVSYILLCGYPPFQADTDREVLQKVKRGTFKFHSPDWDHISGEAMDLIAEMLTYDPKERVPAGKALKGAWLEITKDLQDVVPSPVSGSSFMQRLQTFHEHSKLKRVALTAVAQVLPDEETSELQKLFRDLDTDGDGMLSPQEIRKGLEDLGKTAPPGLDEILKSVDSDGSGCLDYTEFVAATMDHRIYAKREICLAAFRSFDLDGDGKISRQELLNVLSCDDVEKSPSANRVDRMVFEADANGDGCIDFEEFFSMIKSSNVVSRPAPSTVGVVEAAAAALDGSMSPAQKVYGGSPRRQKETRNFFPTFESMTATSSNSSDGSTSMGSASSHVVVE